MAWDPHYYWASGQQPPSRGNSRRWALIVAGVGGALLLALIAVIWVRVASTTAGPTPAANQLTFDQLAPGDCLAGTNMDLGGGETWPDYVTRVPCTHKHEAEVFFAKDIWPQSLAYPGKQAVDDQARARCTAAFDAYDGTDYEESAFSYTQIVDDDSASWAAGNRSLECVAYLPFSTGPSGATPVDYSIKGSKQ